MSPLFESQSEVLPRPTMTEAMAPAEACADIEREIEGQTVPRFFAQQVAERPDFAALRWKAGDDWASITWREWADKSCRIASALKSMGVGHGDRVVLMIRNRPECNILDMAALLVGATPISIYNSSPPDQIEYLVGHCEAKVTVVDDIEFLGRLLSVRERLPKLGHVVVVNDPQNERADGVLLYDQLLEPEPVDFAAAVEICQPSDLATVIYTSGTTGPPKGVMIDHRNVAFAVESGLRMFGAKEQWRQLSYLPMAHIAERMTGYYLPISHGWEVTTCPDPLQLAAYLVGTRPHFFFAVPRIWEKLAAAIKAGIAAQPEKAAMLDKALEAGWQISEVSARGEELPPPLAAAEAQVRPALNGVLAKLGLDQAELAGTGAAPIPFDVLKFWRSLGLPISEVWGLSETTGGATWTRDRPKVGTVGPAMPGIEVKLADDAEVLVRGGNVFRGYLNAPEKTSEVMLPGGWFATGDIGQIDDDGYLKIVDRKKELLITSGGKNVSPANVESKLKEIPLVGQACVIGDGRKYLSALLVLDPDTTAAWAKQQGIEETDLKRLAEHPQVNKAVEAGIDAANTHLNQVESIKRWVLLGEEWLPDSEMLTPTMKLKRRGVLRRYADVIESMYDA